MFIILLKFGENKSNAGAFMSGHNEWINKHLSDGTFALFGSIVPPQGGAIIAKCETREQIDEIVAADPVILFVSALEVKVLVR